MGHFPEFIRLKEKIVSAPGFTPEERDMMLDCLNLGDYAGKHTYPEHFKPGSNRWVTAAWTILDQISPDAMKTRDRFQLGGMIAGALMEMFEAGRKSR